jgi:hypothetical protein
MSALDLWQRQNDAYLTAAVAWIRLRLLRLATRDMPASGRANGPGNGPSDEEISRAATAMEDCARFDPPPAALILRSRCDLSIFELHTLMLCAAMELDTSIASLCAHAHKDPSKAYPTFALALALFPDATWDALSPERPLRSWRLIEIAQPVGVPLTVSPLRADERIVNYLKGLNHLDDRLAMFLTRLASPGQPQACALAPSQQAVADTLASTLSSRAAPDLVHLLGPDSASKQGIACELAARFELSLYMMPAAVLPTSPAELEGLARIWRREVRLLPVALYVDAREADRDVASVTRFLARSSGLVFLDTREPWRSLPREPLTVDVARPTRTEQREIWREQLGDDDVASVLASQFHLSVPEIHRAANTASRETAEPLEDRLWEACRTAARPKLDLLAQRLEPKATWDDLVLPAAETRALREIAAHVRRRVRVYDEWGFAQRMNRGLGVSVLFAGESGTGKTMAAEVIALELKLNLYRIDLSAVVSKYIGETEKNLRQVFDAAEDGGTILFFDEADALFGKRSEVKDSHDRYANIEINYLLQRMEAYSGLAILATNLKSALDTAFLRRLRFILQFPFPAPAERKRIWARAFPSALPKQALDFDFLARLPIAGGTIHNIALKAAFLAAAERAGGGVAAGDERDEGSAPHGPHEPYGLTMAHVLEAARAEFRKLERPVNEADFRWRPTAASATSATAAARPAEVLA